MRALCGCTDEKRAVLVSAKVLDNQVDLFDKCERENDNHDISNTVLHAMELASNLQKIELNEELIDAECENIPTVETDEEMLITMLFTAEQFTFGKDPQFEILDMEYMRNHMVDIILRILNF